VNVFVVNVVRLLGRATGVSQDDQDAETDEEVADVFH